MSPVAAADFERIKQDIAKSVVNSINSEKLLVVESDASDFALAATLRLEHSSFSYDIVYRPDKENTVADAFSRVCANINNSSKLFDLHKALCHPGMTRMYHWTRSKNLTFTLDDIKRITTTCPICAEVKPKFFKQEENHLIKATSPFERLNIDFKGPLPSNTGNHYILTIVDEYSRFPFAISCRDISSTTVINSSWQLLSIFGMPAYIHSDRGSSFKSQELTNF